MDDERIIALFFARSEQAIKEVDLKYGKVCHKISYNILGNNQDAEECVNDTYLGVWNAVPPQRPNPLLTFICKIVRNLSIMRYRKNTAIKRDSTYDVALNEIEYSLSAQDTAESRSDARILARHIEAFLDSLSKENRVIFMRRYWFSDTYEQIAERVGLSEKNVSVRLTRLRKQLKNHLAKMEVYI